MYGGIHFSRAFLWQQPPLSPGGIPWPVCRLSGTGQLRLCWLGERTTAQFTIPIFVSSFAGFSVAGVHLVYLFPTPSLSVSSKHFGATKKTEASYFLYGERLIGMVNF